MPEGERRTTTLGVPKLSDTVPVNVWVVLALGLVMASIVTVGGMVSEISLVAVADTDSNVWVFALS
jgi:hypothetical protein